MSYLKTDLTVWNVLVNFECPARATKRTLKLKKKSSHIYSITYIYSKKGVVRSNQLFQIRVTSFSDLINLLGKDFHWKYDNNSGCKTKMGVDFEITVCCLDVLSKQCNQSSDNILLRIGGQHEISPIPRYFHHSHRLNRINTCYPINSFWLWGNLTVILKINIK